MSGPPHHTAEAVIPFLFRLEEETISGKPDFFMSVIQKQPGSYGSPVVIVAAGVIAGIIRVIAVQQDERNLVFLQKPVVSDAFGRVKGVEEESLYMEIQHFPDGGRLLDGVRVNPFYDKGVTERRGHCLGTPDDLDIGAVIVILGIQDQRDQAAGGSGAGRRSHECALVLQPFDISLFSQLCQRPADSDGAYVINVGILRLCGQLFIQGQCAVLNLLLYGLLYNGIFCCF